METSRSLILAAALWLLGLTSCTTWGEANANPVQDRSTPGPSESNQHTLPGGVSTEPAATSTASSQAVNPLATIATLAPPATVTAAASISPTAAQAPCLLQGGQMAFHTLRTEVHPLPWEFRVYSPPCYHETAPRRYPLLILIHGSNHDDSQWDLIGADEAADRLIAAGEIPPFLILMPRDRVWVEPSEDPFGEALVEHILPWMDQYYRTLPDRYYRALGGLSRGASWAVHLGLSEWEMFGAIGAHSLPVFVTDPPKIRAWLDTIPAEFLPRIYLDIGEKDRLLEHARWFEELLTQEGVPHEWYLFPGRHEDSYWETHIERYLRWYSAGW